MSWSAGASLFMETWPRVNKVQKPARGVGGFAMELIAVFRDSDMDIEGLQGHDAEVDALLEKYREYEASRRAYMGDLHRRAAKAGKTKKK